MDESAAAIAVESFPCAFCSRTYSHVKAKNKHMLAEHSAECEERGMHFKCDQCPQARKWDCVLQLGFSEAAFSILIVVLLIFQVFVSASGRVKHVMRVHNSRVIPAVSNAAFADSSEAPDNIVVDPETGTHQVKCPFEHRDGVTVLVKTVKDFRDHISIDHPDKEKCCLICAVPLSSKGELIEHLQTHSGDLKTPP